MKFIFSKDIRDNRPFAVLILCYLLMAFCYYILQFFLEHYNFGLLPQQILARVNGDSQLFFPAMTWQDLVQSMHIKLFINIFSSLMLLIIFIRTKAGAKTKNIFSTLLFLFLFLDCFSLFLIKILPLASYFKSLSFLLYQLLAIIICTYCINFIRKKKIND